MDKFLISINILALLSIIAHCMCRVTVQQWKLNQPELWIHTALAASSFGALLSNVRGEVHNIFEIGLNIGIACYFLAQTWRLRFTNAKNW